MYTAVPRTTTPMNPQTAGSPQTTGATTKQMCESLQGNGLPLPAPCAPYSRECKTALVRRNLLGSALALGAGSAAAVATHYGTQSTGWTIAAFLVAGTLAQVTYRATTPYGEYPAVCEPTKQQ